MQRLGVFFVATALSVMASPALAFDCAKAASTIEKTICASRELKSLDDRLTERYRTAYDAAQDPDLMRTIQVNWLAERNRCKDAACLEVRYRERLSKLQDYIGAMESDGSTVFVPSAAGPRTCPTLVPPEAPNAQVACKVTSYRVLGDIGGFRRIQAEYAVSYRWNGQDIAYVAPAIMTYNPADAANLALDIVIMAAPGLSGPPDAVGHYSVKHMKATDGDRLVFDLPTPTGARDLRTFRLTRGAWERMR